MITFDAGVLISFFEENDAHHASALRLFRSHAMEIRYLSQITHAETLVHAARQHREEDLYRAIEELGFRVLSHPQDTGVRLAQIRAETGLKLPDCYVILTADQSGSRIATFDDRLAEAARRLGIEVVDQHAVSGPEPESG